MNAYAASVKGKILVREGVSERDAGIIVTHEATHIMRQMEFAPYMKFLADSADKVNFSSIDARMTMEMVLNHLVVQENGELRTMVIEDMADEQYMPKIFDELHSSVYGHYSVGETSGETNEGSIDFRNVFHDYDSYINELQEIHEQFRHRNDSASKGKPAATNPKPAKKASSSPQQQIADEVRKYIENGKSFSAAKLFEIADKAYGGTQAEGTYTVKDAYDGMELAVNQYLMSSEIVKAGNGDTKEAKATLEKMQTLLSKLPTQTKRTAEMEAYQQFSTPPNIAYLAAWTANVDASDVVLEPSAGIGGLALWPTFRPLWRRSEMTEQELAKLILRSIQNFLSGWWDLTWIPGYAPSIERDLNAADEADWTESELLDALSMNLETREKPEDVYEMDELLEAALKVKQALENPEDEDEETAQEAAGELMELVLSNFSVTENL